MQDSDYQLFTESVESELLLEHENDPEAIAKANGILQNMGLDELRERHPASLSGGQKQRLSIAVAYQNSSSSSRTSMALMNSMRVEKFCSSTGAS